MIMKNPKIKCFHIITLFFLTILIVSIEIATANEKNTSTPLETFTKKMEFLAANDALIAQNIANADTPNYKPFELEEKKSPTNYTASLMITNPMHIKVEEKKDGYRKKKREIKNVKPDGNAVNTQYEMMQKNQNSIKLHEAANMYSKVKSMMISAISGE